MKKHLLVMLLIGQLAFLPKIYSQNIAINGTGSLPDTSAMLDVSSTIKGFLAPRMTTSQQNAIILPANGLLIYNTTDNVFKVNTGTSNSPNWVPLAIGSGSISSINGLTAASQTFATGATGSDFGISSSGSAHTFNLPTASTSNRGALSSADWTTFNGKQAAITAPNTSLKYWTGYKTFGSLNDSVRAAISLTTAGTTGAATYNSATGVLNIPSYAGGNGTVTNVSALTLATSGTDISSTVATGTTTPVITLNIPTASATNRGALSAADWTTFNGKQAAIVAPNTVLKYWTGYKTFGSLNDSVRAAIGLTTTGTSGAATYNSTTGILNIPAYAGTVSNVSALTIGTSGTDISSAVATGTTTPVITLNIPTASVTSRGVLSSADWSTFNGKQSAISLTTTGSSGAASFNSATGALNIPSYGGGNGTVTNVSALTLASSGTDVSSSVATGTTTPVITLNIPTASTTNRGVLSSADWATFNGKQSAISLTTTGSSGAASFNSATGALNIPSYGGGNGTVTNVSALTLASSGTDVSSSVATGTTTPVITLNIPTASTTNRGVLSSADWATFNGKQSAISLTTTGSSGAATFNSATGALNIPAYAGSNGTVTNVSALTLGTSGTDIGSTVATGTTTPVITLNIPTASATNRGALSAADWTTFNGKQAAIVSPNTSLKYWTGYKTYGSLNDSVRAAISLTTSGTSGAASYNSTTGVLNIPSYAGAAVQ